MSKAIITVSPAGETKIEVEGHVGPGYRDLTNAIEKALGETIDRTVKPDFTASNQ